MFKFYYKVGSGIFSISINRRLYIHLFIRHRDDCFFGYQKFLDDEYGNYGTFGFGRLMLLCWMFK